MSPFNKEIDMNTQRTLKLSLLALPLWALISCGGGEPSSEVPAPVVPAAPSQGRWTGQAATAGYVALVEPPSASDSTRTTMWVLSADASQLAKLSTQANSSVSGRVLGRVYTLGGDTVAQTIDAASYTVQPSSGLPAQIALQPLGGGIWNFSQTDGFAATGSTQIAQGQWLADLGDVQLSWQVQAQTITGSSSSGCTYSGTLRVVADTALHRVNVTETCAGSAVELSGVATLSAQGQRLSVAGTSADDSLAAVFLFVRQP
jgi:hypothetical protein